MLDFEKLKEFNPALVYMFQAESSRPAGGTDATEGINHMHNVAGQYQDMYDAYMYAQEQVLPWLKTHDLAELSSTKLIEWLQQIHGNIAKTLAKNNEVEAGRFIKVGEEITSWHAGATILQHIKFYFTFPFTEESHKKMAAAKIAGNFPGLNESDFENFLFLAARYRTEPGPLTMDQAEQVLSRLIDAHDKKQLSNDEINVVAKIVKIGMPASMVPQAMNDFARKIIGKWKSCNPDDLEAVSSLLGETFDGLVDIHPFFNANKRTTTCLINIMLRSFNLPSILLRIPDDKRTADLLGEHILRCIKDAQAGKQPSSEDKKQIAVLRVECSDLAKKITRDFPGFNVAKFSDDLFKNDAKKTVDLNNDSACIAVAMERLKENVMHFGRKHRELSVFSSEEGRNSIKLAVKQLSGVDEWAVMGKEAKAWRQFPQAEANSVYKELKANPAFVATKHKVTASRDNSYVIQLQGIDVDALLAQGQAIATASQGPQKNTNK